MSFSAAVAERRSGATGHRSTSRIRLSAAPEHASELDRALDGLAPPGAEHSLARLAFECRATCCTDPPRKFGVVAQSDNGLRERIRVPLNEEAVAAFDQQLACSRRVCGDQRGPDCERLKGLVRDHALGLSARAEDPHRAAGSCVFVGNTLVLDPRNVLDVRGPRVEQMAHLTGADDAKRDVRQATRSFEDQLETVERRRLADKEDMEVLTALPGGPKEPLLGTEVADGHLVDSAPTRA